MCLPLLVWAGTAVVFLVKPGYSDAFHQLGVKTYPLTPADLTSLQSLTIPGNNAAGLTLIRTKLGLHALRAGVASAYPRDADGALLPLADTEIAAHSLYVPSEGVWRAIPELSRAQSELVLRDAQTQWPARYGTTGEWKPATSTILEDSAEPSIFLSDTQVAMQLHSATLTITQSGPDTRWINRAYRWHYLQWTGVAYLDRILALLGLALLVLMTSLGIRMLRKA